MKEIAGKLTNKESKIHSPFKNLIFLYSLKIVDRKAVENRWRQIASGRNLSTIQRVCSSLRQASIFSSLGHAHRLVQGIRRSYPV